MTRTLLISGIVALVAIAAVLYFFFRSPGSGIGRNYSAYGEQCSRTQFLCIQGTVRFDDATGCGCEPVNVSK